jgi:hypothetical protein
MVLIEIAPLLFIGQFRSQCCPSINADIAVFDSDIDIDFATSNGVTPSANLPAPYPALWQWPHTGLHLGPELATGFEHPVLIQVGRKNSSVIALTPKHIPEHPKQCTNLY